MSAFRSNSSGVYMLVGSIPLLIVNFSYLEGVSVSSKQLRDIVVCINGDQDLAPRLLLTVCFSWVSYPLLSLVKNGLDLPIGTQGRSRRANEGCFL